MVRRGLNKFENFTTSKKPEILEKIVVTKPHNRIPFSLGEYFPQDRSSLRVGAVNDEASEEIIWLHTNLGPISF